MRASRQHRRAVRATLLTVCFLLLAAGPMAGGALASHLRFGHVTWDSPSPNTADFTIQVALRCNGPCLGLGDTFFDVGSVFDFGDSNSISEPVFTVVDVNAGQDWFLGEATASHTYSSGSFTAAYLSCCTASNTNNAPDSDFRVPSLVDFTDSSSPVSALNPVIVVGGSGVQSWNVNATDASSHFLTYRLATAAEACGTFASVGCTGPPGSHQPPGLTVDSSGQVSWNTSGVAAGLWYTSVVIEDTSGSPISSSQVNYTILVQRPAPPANPDSDGDGVPDSSDACPTVRGTLANGCPDPDPDTDGDGLRDSKDGCPLVAAKTSNGCPLPKLGETAFVKPVGPGDVFVKLPGNAARKSDIFRVGDWGHRSVLASGFDTYEPARATAKAPKGFISLRDAGGQIPFGSQLDTRHGKVRLSTAKNSKGKIQSADFDRGLFKISQSRKKRLKGLTEVRLLGGNFKKSCKSSKKRARKGNVEAARKKRIRSLRGKGKGNYSTRGKGSSNTVRGTTWTVTDRCDGTLTNVTSGTVVVRDFRRKKNITLRARKGGRRSYLAKYR